MALNGISLEQLVEILKQQGFRVGRDSEGDKKKVILDERHFRHLEKLSGGAGGWSEWLFNLIVVLGQVAPEVVRAVELVVDGSSMFSHADSLRDKIGEEVYGKYRGELFSVVCGITGGEANGIVRGVVSGSGNFGYCGFAALHLLAQRYNPKTPARLLQCVSNVISPPQVKNIKDLPRALQEWEALTAKLSRDFSEVLSENVRIAVLVGMLPKDFQELVFQWGSLGKDLGFAEVRDKVLTIATHRAQMAQPVPMDIGAMEGDYNMEEFGGYECVEDWSGEIMAMGTGGNVKCLRCGGWGHYARECATPIDDAPDADGLP